MTAKVNEAVRAKLTEITQEMIAIQKLMDLSFEGLRMITHRGELFELFDSHSPANPEDIEEQQIRQEFLSRISKDADFIKTEQENDFTRIHEMHLVYAWSRMDSSIKDVLAEYISVDQSLANYDKIPKMTIDSSFFALSDKDKAYYIITQIEQKLGVPMKQGIGKFESLLDVFGKSGGVPKRLSDAIFEISNLRNIIVHNNSVTDEKFMRSCPNLGYSLGQRIHLNKSMLDNYIIAIGTYLSILTTRFLGVQYPEEVMRQWE